MSDTNSKQEICDHYWHANRGAMMVCLPDGFIVQRCCKCHETRSIHADHAMSGNAKKVFTVRPW